MAEDQSQGTATSGDATQSNDLIKNMKSEFDRKLDNFQTTLKSTTDALTAKLNQIIPKAPVVEKKPFRDRFYEDEDAAVSELKAELRQEFRGTLEERDKQMNTMTKLYSDYPELAEDSPLTKEAVKIINSLPVEERNTPTAYRAAVLEAAAELGIQPAKKRKKETVEDTGGGGEGGGNSGGKRGTLSNDTLEFAALMGLDTNDPKVVERLKGHAKRNFNTYR